MDALDVLEQFDKDIKSAIFFAQKSAEFSHSIEKSNFNVTFNMNLKDQLKSTTLRTKDKIQSFYKSELDRVRREFSNLRGDDDWVRTKENEIRYDSRVGSQTDVDILYGEEADYVSSGYEYTSNEGNFIQLGDYGFFKKDGVVTLAKDYGKEAKKIIEDLEKEDPVDYSGEIMAGGLMISGVLLADDATIVGVADDPAIPFVIAGAALAALIAKMAYEIERINRRNPGPNGTQYSLKAKADGIYICYTCPSNTIELKEDEVWKYGETTQSPIKNRYNKNSYELQNFKMIPEFTGTQIQIKIVEKEKIYHYFFTHGHLPPGNKIFR